MKATSTFLQGLGITKPTLILDKGQAIGNIGRMVRKVSRSGTTLRPHFKTHQSAGVGELFRQNGVRLITVSSLDMAVYFAEQGWTDITVAIPVNVLEMGVMNKLAERIQLNVVVDSVAAVGALAVGLTRPVQVWLEIDPGYGRTGVAWDDLAHAWQIAVAIEQSDRCEFAGLLSHAGQSYGARATAEIMTVYEQSVARLRQVQARLLAGGMASCAISLGDTPTASVVDDWPGVDELRPGNFVFYDLAQVQIGSCRSEEIAVAVACPVIGKYPARQEVVVHGGAVHLSKEALVEGSGREIYGYLTTLQNNTFGSALTHAPVTSISQEHGKIHLTDSAIFDAVELGDLLLILPVHSCLTINLFRAYRTLGGEVYGIM